jgi:hypothetical protein
MHRLPLILGLLTATVCASPVPQPAPERAEVTGRRLSVSVADSPGATLIRALPGNEVLMKIDWLLGAEPVPVFSRHGEAEPHRLVSRVRMGNTTITRTILSSPADGLVFIHLLADMPGALSFRAALTPPAEGSLQLIDRRQLHWQGPPQRDLREARLWVLPFESEVEPSPAGILLRGEGEALLILDFGADLPENTLELLGTQHAPGQIPADPSRIWRSVTAAGT